MSITPPSDIVMDVARAADPARYQEAASKLSQPGDPAAFASAADEAAREAGLSTHLPLDAHGTLTGLKNDTALKGSADPYRKFEGQVIQQFVEAMLPKAETVFGKGNAGGIWKSMLAEQLGQQIAKTGGIGIARMLDKSHPITPTPSTSATGVASKV
ncbi:rod-binding protein [Methylorubrum zatmanii]|uniref:Rod-binding protein n=1 Tax=Methylorubrum zatmanii TaxID=29429 RepID=A0ABW1WRY0_9HYPH|nr:rod-binding protein [Methylorubrum zatmanii]MBD8909027.1 flagellar biosynthesis protein FlgJ [Methylorubrum zatmanii]